MKNVSYGINGVVASAIITISLFLLSSCNGTGVNATDGTKAEPTESGEFSGEKLPIAYVNIDSLLIKYEYAKDVNERLTKKVEDMRLTVNQKGRQLEKDMADFQHKIQNNAFLSEQRAQQEANQIQKQQQDLEQLGQRMQNELAMEQNKENMQIADSVRTVVKLYNQTGKYQMIFNMKELDNIILANPQYDITQDILTLLNSRYKPEVKK